MRQNYNYAKISLENLLKEWLAVEFMRYCNSYVNANTETCQYTNCNRKQLCVFNKNLKTHNLKDPFSDSCSAISQFCTNSTLWSILEVRGIQICRRFSRLTRLFSFKRFYHLLTHSRFTKTNNYYFKSRIKIYFLLITKFNFTSFNKQTTCNL